MPSAPATIALPLLSSVRVASPCTARWDDMTGDEVTRHCGLCKLNVHNLTGMPRDQAEAFLRRAVESRQEGAGDRVCVRFFRRADGTILTHDCPRGVAAARARVRRAVGALAALIGLAGASAAAATHSGNRMAGSLRSLPPIVWLRARLNPAPPSPPMMGKMVMGEMCIAPPPSSTSGTPAPTAPISDPAQVSETAR